jgi:hypothetical protein
LTETANDRKKIATGQTPAIAQTNFNGYIATATYTTGGTYRIVKPGEALIIRALRLNQGESPPRGAWPAQDLVNNIGQLRS